MLDRTLGFGHELMCEIAAVKDSYKLYKMTIL